MSLKQVSTKWLSLLAGLALLLVAFTPLVVDAAQITGRSFTLSDSDGAATGVGYTFASVALPTSGTAVKSVAAEACTTATGACSTPSGFSIAAATLASQPSGLGSATGWTVNTATAGSLRIVNAANATTPSGAVSIPWGGVVNPTADNTTFFLRLSTYSDAAWATPIDTGTVAVSTGNDITVTASIDETLSFCVYTGINCGAGGATVALGSLSASTTGTGTSKMDAATNADSGYAITYAGNTLTSGGNTITAISPAAASAQGSEQFGLNLKDNTTPNVGAEVSGSGSGASTGDYDTADTFKFLTGESVAAAAGPTLSNTFTVSYIANITATTEAGSYESVINWIATATF